MEEYESSKGLRSAIELATEEWRASASLRALKRQIQAACSLDFVPGDRPMDHGSWRVRW